MILFIGQVLFSSFNELCDRAVGASDYIQLAQYFHTIIIKDIPRLNLKLKSQTRRFITLIDSLYDNRIRVVISSEVPLKELFSNEKPTALEISDEHRHLMDDLKLNKDSVGTLSFKYKSQSTFNVFLFILVRLSCKHIHGRRRNVRFRSHKIEINGNANGGVLATLGETSIKYFPQRSLTL